MESDESWEADQHGERVTALLAGREQPGLSELWCQTTARPDSYKISSLEKIKIEQ